DFDKYRPDVIFAEFINLPDDEKLLFTKLLEQNNYLYTTGFDIIAIKEELLHNKNETQIIRPLPTDWYKWVKETIDMGGDQSNVRKILKDSNFSNDTIE